MNKVCIIAHDPISPQIAGPTIRFLEIARALSRKFDVTFAVPNDAEFLKEPFKTVKYDYKSLKKLVAHQDVVYVFGFLLSTYPYLKNISAALVVDIYCPILFEALANNSNKDLDIQNPLCISLIDNFQVQLMAGDFFICAAETQRDMWLGMLWGCRRINPYTFAKDKTLRSLIDVVSFGLPETPPVKKQNVLKGVHPAIRKEDKVFLWGGGLYDWLDPKTAVKAMALVQKERSDVKLFFMGCKHPLSNIKMEVIEETKKLSDSLGLTGKSVLFNDNWISYKNRADYLLEADIGLNLHYESIETDFSFRTRIMDYIWAELPIITTRGGYLSNLVEEKNLGSIVNYNDPGDLAKKILQMVDGELPLKEFSSNIKAMRHEFYWSRVIEPLEKFCQSPVKGIDRNFHVDEWTITIIKPFHYYKKACYIYKTRGLIKLLKKVFLFIGTKCSLCTKN